MSTYKLRDTYVGQTIYTVEADTESDARRLAAELDTYPDGFDFDGTDVVAVDGQRVPSERPTGAPVVTFGDGCDTDTLVAILSPLAGWDGEKGDGWCIDLNGETVVVRAITPEGISWAPFDPETAAGNDEVENETPWIEVQSIQVN